MDQKELKELAGKTAVDRLVRSGMKLGLGTGSTAMPAVRRVGALLAEGKLTGILAVPTSFQTSIECEKLGIPQFSLNSREIGGHLDLTIDGADQVDPRNRCTKGGGGALLLEKLVAYNSDRFAVVVDESKLTSRLGLSFPIPVEVIPEARVSATQALEKLGAAVSLREAVRKAGPVITEHANLILDIRFEADIDPAELELRIQRIPGVVECGLFTQLPPTVFVAHADSRIEEIAPCR